MNLDVASAIATAVGALPKVMVFREEASHLPGFDVSHFDCLHVYVFALSHAHASVTAASAPLKPIADLNKRGIKLRDTLYLDTVGLAHRGIIAGDRIAEFKTRVGYKNLARDLLGLHDLLRANWDKVACRTGIQLSEINEAEQVGQELMAIVGAREQASGGVARAQAQRQRNFTLFSRAYNQVRRAISFLRWDHDDLEQICPSLFAGRGRGRRREEPPLGMPETSIAGPPPRGSSGSAPETKTDDDVQGRASAMACEATGPALGTPDLRAPGRQRP